MFKLAITVSSLPCVQDMYFGYYLYIPCIVYCATSKTSEFLKGRRVKIIYTFDADTVPWCIQHYPS